MVSPSRIEAKRARTRVVVCGQRAVALRCLEYLLGRPDTELCAIVASPKDWQADLIAWGVEHKVKVFVGNVNHYKFEINNICTDFIFSIQYGPLLKPPILRAPRRGCVNLHFGLLPRYGGCYPIAWAILNGEERAGATLHYMTENFDEGAVLAQTAVPVTPETTARELYDAVGGAAVQLFADCYPALLAGTLNAQGQDLSKKLYYSNKSIDFERDRRIDWGRPGIEIQRRICAFSFEPFQSSLTSVLLPDARRLQVTVSRTRLVRDRERSAEPGWAGRVVEVTTSGGLVVGTGSDDLVEIGLLDDRTPLDLLGSLGLGPGDIRLCNIE
jgi:methionyl-tRNA formyltransferase